MAKLLLSCKSIGNKGFILVTVIWLIALISLVALGGLILSSTEYQISLDHVKAKQAYYLAEAGLEEGLNRLSINPSNKIDLLETTDTGTITVKQLGGISDIISLESTGAIGDVKKNLNLQLEFTFLDKQNLVFIELSDLYLSSMDTPTEIYRNILCGGNLSIQNNYGIKGNVYCLGSTELAKGSFIEGDVYNCDKLSLKENSFIKGRVYTKSLEAILIDDSSFIEGEIVPWDGKAPIKIINLQEK